MKEEKNLINCLKDEKVLIQYIRRSSIFDKTGNPASGGLHENSIIPITAPVDVDGSYKKILTQDEIDFLQTQFDADISFKNKEFWSNMRVVLKKEGLPLDLKNPIEYIQYKIVEAWSNPNIVRAQQMIICPSLDRINERKEFKFVIVKPDEVAKAKRANFDKKKAAYMLIGKLEKDRDILKYLYWETTKDKRVASDTFTANDLLNYFDNLIENNPAQFTIKAEDKLLYTKALIFNAWSEGVIKMENKEFLFRDKKLADGDDVADMETAANFINHPIRQEIKFGIEAALKEKRNK